MNIDISPIASKSLIKIQNELTNLLRVDAVLALWPKNIASKLKVVITKSEIIITYPNNLAQQVEDLEYGSKETTPLPVFRRFIAKHGNVISNNIADSTLNFLVDEGIIP